MSGNLEICSRQREGQEPGGGAGEPEGCPPGRTGGDEVSDTKGSRSRRAWRATAGSLSFLSEVAGEGGL